MTDEPGRHRPAHFSPAEVGFRSILVFVTVCTKARQPVLATVEMRNALLEHWQNADHWRVGRYVIMPDHVHFFCAPGRWPPPPLRGWMAFWKNGMSRQFPALTLWQRDFWDTQLRRDESYAAKWEYVRHNPVRQGLVARMEDWPYQGELHRLEWHD